MAVDLTGECLIPQMIHTGGWRNGWVLHLTRKCIFPHLPKPQMAGGLAWLEYTLFFLVNVILQMICTNHMDFSRIYYKEAAPLPWTASGALSASPAGAPTLWDNFWSFEKLFFGQTVQPLLRHFPTIPFGYLEYAPTGGETSYCSGICELSETWWKYWTWKSELRHAVKNE